MGVLAFWLAALEEVLVTISDNRFSQRVGRALGGNRAAGPLDQFSLDITSQLDYCTWFNDFITTEDYDGAAGATQPWVEDDIGAPAADGIGLNFDSVDGTFLVNAGTAADTGLQTQYTGTDAAGAFLDRGDHQSFSFGTRLKKDVAANGNLFVGLCIADVTAMTAADGLINASDFLGFWCPEDSALLSLAGNRAGGTVTYGDAAGGTTTVGDAQSITLANDTYVDVAFVCHTNDISTLANSAYCEAFQWVAGAAGAPSGTSKPRWASMGSLKNLAIPSSAIDLAPTIIAKNGPVLLLDLTLDYFWVSSRRI